MRWLSIVLAEILLVGAVEAAGLPNAPPETVGMSSERLERLTNGMRMVLLVPGSGSTLSIT